MGPFDNAVAYARRFQKKSSPASAATATTAPVHRSALEGAEDCGAAITGAEATGTGVEVGATAVATGSGTSRRSVANGSRGGSGPGCTAL